MHAGPRDPITLALPRSLASMNSIGYIAASMNSIGYIALAVLRGALTTTLVQDIHTHYRKEVISVLDRLATTRNSVMCKGQLKVLQNLLPASSGVERGGRGGGLVPRGPGQLWGPRPSWVFNFFFLI